MSEFDLIARYFAALGPERPDVVLGVGDDCALLEVPPGQRLAVSIDTLVSGVHFFADCNPEHIGHKALAVGLSDLAAMGAEPAWATLALTLPAPEEDWIRAFTLGLGRLANVHGMHVVGGDTTRGPLSVTVQVHGLVPKGAAIRRSGARPGDAVFVSGTLGDAGLALRRMLSGEPVAPELRHRLECPAPRVALGRQLRGIATAMIDLSDGLAGDLGHILTASGVGADLELERLPLTPQVAAVVAATNDWSLPLTAGDDYELCFCVPPAHIATIGPLAETLGLPLTRVGWIRAGAGLAARAADGGRRTLPARGYDHFPAAVDGAD
ncbi:thiamine-phosphate kinase [Thermochromatium tepidum]|uniref:Thiamine-monophosphate kinase n=1 Tax=Thermochromatium tepidum ATCC 43061 TaxID=316276 RepID=A0A6I6E5R0_THETI|nr:thiamine-phosphate kinase [Thermochromatium tepidum]QGU31808.1 thiamine-phosphate kinase [Thermochromatium tepidum ATCC 43061]